MIVAGFSGVGKTYFCENTRNAIDFIIMPFKYSNFYHVSKNLSEDEEVKANEDLDFVFGWEEYYYYALIDTYKKFPDEIIVIPTVISVLEKLREDGVPVTIVYPSAADKKEYERRYKSRGNSDAFLNLFLERWDEWVSTIQKHLSDATIELNTNEYLSDVIRPVSYDENHIITNKETYIYDTYFKNGLDKGFLQTPFGQLMEDFKIYK